MQDGWGPTPGGSAQGDVDCNVPYYGTDNYGDASDPDIDAMLDKQRAETNLEARKKLIAEIIEKIRARRTSLYLYHQNLFAAYSARVVGLEMYADGMPRLKSACFAPEP